MKYISKITFALILALTIFACSSDETERTTELSSIEDILSEMRTVTSEQNKAVKFKVTYLDGKYKSEDVRLIEPFEYQFEASYSNRAFGGVTVECSDRTITNCSGSNEGSCVGAAVKACLDKGECANVCPAEIMMAPLTWHDDGI